MAWIQGRLDGTSCVGELCPRRPARRRVQGRGLAPTAFKMSPLPGLNSHSSSVKVPCCTVAATPASCHQSAPTHWFLAPVGAASSVPWAQAHGDQAELALAASSWLTKENKSYRAATGGAFDGMDSAAARWNNLCW